MARRVCWTLLVLFGIGCSSYLVYNRLHRYLQFPVAVNVDLVTPSSLVLPGVTLCPAIQMGVTWFANNNRPELLPAFLKYLAATYHPNVTCLKDPICHAGLANYLNPLSAEQQAGVIKQMADGLILDCKHQKQECPEAPKYTPTDQGGCLTTGSVNRKWLVHGPGRSQGIELTAALFANNTMPMMVAESDGFLLSINMPKLIPYNIRETTLVVPPEHHVRIALTQKSITRSPDLSGCNNDVKYSQPLCFSNCVTQNINAQCGCEPPRSTGSETYYGHCMNAANFSCVLVNYYQFHSNSSFRESLCNCPDQCHVTQYEMIITTSPTHPGHLLHGSEQYGNVQKGENQSESDASSSQVRHSFINIYYNSMSYEHTTQLEAYSYWDLLSDIGGALGLFLGSAIYTLIEILDYLVVLATRGRKRSVPRRKVTNIRSIY